MPLGPEAPSTMECAICGDDIRVGQPRVPGHDGTVHESCRDGEPKHALENARRPGGRQARFRALVLLLTVVAAVYGTLKWAVRALRRRLG